MNTDPGMNSSMHYREWTIRPFAIPLPNGQWSASCEIEREDADGLDTFQSASSVSVRDTKADAIAAACEDARHQIDGIIADPLG